jgi:hypothetical protein
LIFYWGKKEFFKSGKAPVNNFDLKLGNFMRKNCLQPVTIILLFTFCLSSCWSVIDDEQVKEDTLEQLKEKYSEDFSVLSITNDTQGHGKGALWPTGNVFTVEMNSIPGSKEESPTWFQAYVAYDSNKQFVYYGDTYKQQVIGDQMARDFSKILQEGDPSHIACNLFFDGSDNSKLDQVDVKKADYKEILPKCPYAISLRSGSVYFFKPYPASGKATTEYLRKYLMKLQVYKLSDIDLFVYYWDENLLKEKPIDSLRFAWGYEYHEGYFETGKTFDKRFRLQLKKEELDHLDTLNLSRWLKEI